MSFVQTYLNDVPVDEWVTESTLLLSETDAVAQNVNESVVLRAALEGDTVTLQRAAVVSSSEANYVLGCAGGGD
ncbi:hypothetical protein AaE_004617 [Aphanomyces astaci]|uniref:Uncharacterized protein n=1 Tax=Aphanomyces astaci TaxID=112090 RepID=A0A6A5ANH6_APHAT|nr:hypothetical protein AaE_004617 [Aphanomyces astaci]